MLAGRGQKVPFRRAQGLGYSWLKQTNSGLLKSLSLRTPSQPRQTLALPSCFLGELGLHSYALGFRLRRGNPCLVLGPH